MERFILIVDDDAELRLSLAQVLAAAGFETRTASNGVEAIDMLERGERPAMILVDLVMPGVIGSSVLDYLRDEPSLADIPVAIMTGSPQLAPEGYTVFRKPLDVGALRDFARQAESHP